MTEIANKTSNDINIHLLFRTDIYISFNDIYVYYAYLLIALFLSIPPYKISPCACNYPPIL